MSRRRPAQIFATPTGWTMKSSPDLRRWSAWCSQAKTNAPRRASRSTGSSRVRRRAPRRSRRGRTSSRCSVAVRSARAPAALAPSARSTASTGARVVTRAAARRPGRRSRRQCCRACSAIAAAPRAIASSAANVADRSSSARSRERNTVTLAELTSTSTRSQLVRARAAAGLRARAMRAPRTSSRRPPAPHRAARGRRAARSVRSRCWSSSTSIAKRSSASPQARWVACPAAGERSSASSAAVRRWVERHDVP